MWKKILELRDFNGDKIFPNLESLIIAIFSLLYSNVKAQQIFSIVLDIKHKRNRLSNDTICITRSSFQTQGINCLNFYILSPDI